MKKTKNDQPSKKTKNMLGDEIGGMEDLRTHEDFNNQHPNEIDPSIKKKEKTTENDKISKKKSLVKPTKSKI